MVAMGVSWKHLSTSQQDAALLCGVSSKVWDGPSECTACFADLTPDKQHAVLAMGADEECWNQQFKASGRDCEHLTKQENSTVPETLYSGISRKFKSGGGCLESTMEHCNHCL